MDGYYFKADKMCNSKVFVYPVENHYEDEGEPEYIKYGCPVCETFGCRHSMVWGIATCPICGVRLLWSINKEYEMMKHSKWKVTSQYIGGEKMYAVYRLKDINKTDHSGNREYIGSYITNRLEAIALADELNKQDKC